MEIKLNFVDLDNYLPIDKKTLHTKITNLVEKKWMKKEIDANGKIIYSVEGKGSDNPKADNETLVGRIANRRVEIEY